MRRLVLLAWSGLALVAGLPCALDLQRADARPLTIRARTQVALALDRRADGLVVRGTLVDDQRRPVAGEGIHLDVEGYDIQRRLTDEGGAFEVAIGGRDLARLEARHGHRLPWALSFSGDRFYGDSSASGEFDLRRVPTFLEVSVRPCVVGLDDSEILVEVTLASGPTAPIADAEVLLQVGDGKALAGTTGPSGQATFLIRSGLLGSAGRYTVRARFDGDHVHAASSGEDSLRVLLPARLTLRVGREGDALVGRYRFSGRLADVEGPIPDAVVAIIARLASDDGASTADLADGDLLTLTNTRADGVYLTALSAAQLMAGRTGELEVRAVYSPGDGAHQVAMSRPVHVRVPPPPGVPLRWYLVGLALIVALLVTVQLARTGALTTVWTQLLAAHPPASDAEVLAEADDDPPFIQAPAGRAAMRERRRDVIAGAVVDAHSGAPLAAAMVTLTLADGSRRRVTTDDAGHFALSALPAGQCQLAVVAPAYLQRELAATLPHDGSLDGAAFGLVAVRRRLREAYTRAILVADSALLWGLDTPREAYANARRADERVERALVELRRLVELAWFSEHPATAADVVRASQLLAAIEGRR